VANHWAFSAALFLIGLRFSEENDQSFKNPRRFLAMDSRLPHDPTWQQLRELSVNFDCQFRLKSGELCPAHRAVLVQSSEFWNDYFHQPKVLPLTIDIPFDLHNQFITFVNFCYDPNVALPEQPDLVSS
jgi:hypothetical protein